MDKQIDLLPLCGDGAFRPQSAIKEAFGEGVGCRAKVGEFGGLEGATQASI